MTNSEYKYIISQHTKLAETENRTELENLRYRYCDKVINYVELVKTARSIGNKHPENNFLIKDAACRMKEAEQKLREYLARNPESVACNASV